MIRKNFVKLFSTTILAFQALSFFPTTSLASTFENVASGESSENPIEASVSEESSSETAVPSQPSESSSEDTTPSESSESSSEDTAPSESSESSSEDTAPSESSESSSEDTAPSESSESSSEDTAPSESSESSSEDTAPSESSESSSEGSTGSSISKETDESAREDSLQNSTIYDSKTPSHSNSYANDIISPSESSINNERNKTVEKFILEIGDDARELAQKNDLYASVMIAQAILESGSGTSYLSDSPYYNIFGIKGSHNGNSVLLPTMEDSGNGTLYMVDSQFKAYNNYKESLEDYVDLIVNGITGNKEFYKNVWKSNTKNYKDATKALTGSYATDIHYNEKLNSLIETYDLQEYDKAKKETDDNSDFIYPLDNFIISSPFGNRGSEFHRGTDFAAPSGTEIHASDGGTVVTASFDPSWGNYVVISHENGMYTLYAHQEHYTVTPGKNVKQGDVIGYVGSTGHSTGSHLHFEVSLDSSLKKDSLIDPISVLPK